MEMNKPLPVCDTFISNEQRVKFFDRNLQENIHIGYKCGNGAFLPALIDQLEERST